MCCLYLYSFDGDSGLSNLTDSKWEEQSHWESDSVEHGSHQEGFLSSEDISSEPIHNEGAQLDKSRGWEEKAKIESSVVGSPSNNSNLLSENILIVKCFLVIRMNLLSGIMNKVSKWFLPAVHLDYLHTIDNFTHQSDSLVCFPSSLHPQPSKLLSHPCCRICCYDNKLLQ